MEKNICYLCSRPLKYDFEIEEGICESCKMKPNLKKIVKKPSKRLINIV
jgi:hypothetical protein